MDARTGLVIIGAGISGLAAAKTLEEGGFYNYLLLEAADRVGGRVHSLKWTDGTFIEIGAQFLHGDNSKLAEICRECRLLSKKEFKEAQGFYIQESGVQTSESLVAEVDDFIRSTLEDCEEPSEISFDEPHNRSIGNLLRHRFDKFLLSKNLSSSLRRIYEKIFDWNTRFLVIDNSCRNLEEVSVKHWGKFKYVGGPEHLIFESGYGSLIETLVEKLDRSNIQLNTAVETIEWHKNSNQVPIRLTLNTGKSITADCVIVTSSLGYLKENYKKLFKPALPFFLTQSIENMGFGIINKVFLEFESPFWTPETKGFQLLFEPKDKEIFETEVEEFSIDGTKKYPLWRKSNWTRDLTGFDVVPGEKALLLGWVGGEGAEIVEKLDEEQVAFDCVELLRNFLERDDIPVPKRCKRSQWYSNKYVRGGYSYISVNCDSLDTTPATLSKPVWRKVRANGVEKRIPLIMFAGEATHECFYSTTHGAFDTGVKQARVFLEAQKTLEENFE